MAKIVGTVKCDAIQLQGPNLYTFKAVSELQYGPYALLSSYWVLKGVDHGTGSPLKPCKSQENRLLSTFVDLEKTSFLGDFERFSENNQKSIFEPSSERHVLNAPIL